LKIAARVSNAMPPTAKRSIEILQPRLATSLLEARRRTGIVHILRLVFTCAAVMSAGFLLGPVVNHSLRREAPALPQSVKTITIVNPRFEGHDNQDQPYVVTADTATRRPENLDMTDLFAPRMQDQNGTLARAREGIWDKEGEILDLYGDVRITDAAGYTFETERARIYASENRVEGETPLSGYGPIGEVRADKYEVLDRGDRIVLKGNVWTRYAKPKDAPSNPNGAQ
jgi:lipopolysaccharide export system protein LptC